MRAVQIHELGGPENLRVDEVPDPVAGAGEVLVEVKAAALNFPDILLCQGKYQIQPTLPFSPGGELAGVVSAVGDGVEGFAPGDRVAATIPYGAFAEKVAVPAMTLVKLPDAVSYEVGASFLITYATSYYALKDRADLQSGESLLVLGAAGGVGLAAVELGNLMGAEVIAAASTDEKLAVCRERGAKHTINYSTENLKTQAKSLSNGGVNVIYDPVGGSYSEQALRTMAWEGRFLVIGFTTGEIPKLPLNLVLLKSCQVVGVYWGVFAMREAPRNRANIETLLGWLAAGKLKPHIDVRYPLEEAPQAMTRMMNREVKGKVLIVP